MTSIKNLPRWREPVACAY